MADTSPLEAHRATHEEAERLQSALVDTLLAAGSTHREALRRAHRASALLDAQTSRHAALAALYADADGVRRAELARIDGDGAGASELGGFYTRLAALRAYHAKYPGATPDAFHVPPPPEPTAPGVLDEVDRLFSGEEAGGRFLDLATHHTRFINLKGVRRMPYLRFLAELAAAAPAPAVPRETKRSESYKRYLDDLNTYLLAFLRNTRPLSDIDYLELSALADFEETWEQRAVPGWEDWGEDVWGKSAAPAAREESEAPKEGVWCEACKRTFAKQTVYDGHLSGAKHQKAAARLAAGGGSEAASGSGGASASEAQSSAAAALDAAKRLARSKALARAEVLLAALRRELAEVLAETRANVERKAALTDKERQAEALAAAGLDGDAAGATESRDADARGAAGDDNDDDDDERIYNPLKLPLGWDGKPIPYWLYKLHGLGVEYRCEICSDFVYQGRKNFERHFSESRHAFGMRALGLPNTKHFHEITKIEDALALAEKLKRQGKQVAEAEGDAEEVEDEHGNTYTKKTYELLKRQGII